MNRSRVVTAGVAALAFLLGGACGWLLFGRDDATSGRSGAGGAASTVAASATGTASGCREGQNPPPPGDLDGDGSADIVVGVPDFEPDGGLVDVRYAGRRGQRLNSGQVGGRGEDLDGFGTAIAVGDLDGDGCADLVIGAPGESNGRSGEQRSYPGQVHLVFGGTGGLDLHSAFVLPQAAASYARFGAALALTRRGEVHDLYVGAPDATVGGRQRAGQVYRYTITPGGPRRVQVTAREVRGQDSPGVPDVAEADDRFGAVLAAADDGLGVFAGDPGEDVGSAVDAGKVWYLRVDVAGYPIRSQSWSQGDGVPGVAEARDRFGAAVSSRGRRTVIGVPGEDVGRVRDAGMAQVLYRGSAGGFLANRMITQGDAGIPGAPGTGDRFGRAVALGRALTCPGSLEVAIGAPGERVGRHPGAGTVTLVPLASAGATGCRAKVVRQGRGLAGAPETADRVGSVLSVVRGTVDPTADDADDALIGIPDEDFHGLADAGVVQPLSGDLLDDRATRLALRFPASAPSGHHYGAVLSSSSD